MVFGRNLVGAPVNEKRNFQYCFLRSAIKWAFARCLKMRFKLWAHKFDKILANLFKVGGENADVLV